MILRMSETNYSITASHSGRLKSSLLVSSAVSLQNLKICLVILQQSLKSQRNDQTSLQPAENIAICGLRYFQFRTKAQIYQKG